MLFRQKENLITLRPLLVHWIRGIYGDGYWPVPLIDSNLFVSHPVITTVSTSFYYFLIRQ